MWAGLRRIRGGGRPRWWPPRCWCSGCWPPPYAWTRRPTPDWSASAGRPGRRTAWSSTWLRARPGATCAAVRWSHAVAGHPLTDPPGGVARPSYRGGPAVHGGRRRTPGHHAAAGAAGPAARRLGQPRLRAGPRRAGPGALRSSSRGAGDVGLAGRRVRSVRQHPGRRRRAARPGPRHRRTAALALPPVHQRGVPGGVGRHGGDGPAADPGASLAPSRPPPGPGQRVRRSGRSPRAVGGRGGPRGADDDGPLRPGLGGRFGGARRHAADRDRRRRGRLPGRRAGAPGPAARAGAQRCRGGGPRAGRLDPPRTGHRPPAVARRCDRSGRPAVRGRAGGRAASPPALRHRAPGQPVVGLRHRARRAGGQLCRAGESAGRGAGPLRHRRRGAGRGPGRPGAGAAPRSGPGTA